MTIKDERLLDIFRAMPCEHCGYHTAEPHHVYAKGMGGGGRLDVRVNLVALCRVCHSQHHNGNSPTRAVLLGIVAQREKTTTDAIQDEIYRLRRQPKVMA